MSMSVCLFGLWCCVCLSMSRSPELRVQSLPSVLCCGSLLLMLLAAAAAELTVDDVCFRRQSSGMRVLVVVRSSLLSTQVRLFLPTSSVVQGLCNGRVSVCLSVCVVD